jgi:hypothetical protein
MIVLFLLFGVYEPAWASPITEDSSVHPQSLPAQTQSNDPGHLFLLPVAASPLKLISHTVDVTVQVEADQMVFTVKAAYRLHNSSKESISPVLKVAPARSHAGEWILPQAISLTVDGQPLALTPTGQEAQQNTQATIPADGRRLFVLNYRVTLAASELATFRYPMSQLSGWSSPPESWRITLNLPGESTGLLPAESWTITEPAGWTYTGNKVQWMGEGRPPAQITLQAIHPRLWRDLRETRRLLVTEPSLDRFIYLGDLYSRLYRTQINGEDHRRFYAETLAAYADGLRYGQQVNAPAAELAPLHLALTALYRSRSIQNDGTLDPLYIDFMVTEAQKALAAFPEADERRDEVARWLAEGMRLQLRRAQELNDWPAAFNILAEMERLPSSLFDPAWLAAEQQVVQMQQALDLFEQGEQDAAVALTRPEMQDETLLPRPENRTLLSSWQVTFTLQADAITLEAVAQPAPGRQALAHQTFQQFIGSWQAVTANAQGEIRDDGRMLIRLDDFPLSQRMALAQATPAITDWLLLRSLLVNLEPTVQRSDHLIWQEVEITQRLDLRSVAEQWQGMAALLERQAAQDPTVTATTSTAIENVEEELRGQLRRLYHRQEAQNWQALVRNSVVHIEAQASTAATRTWSAQITDPPQTLNFHTQVLNLMRVVIAIMTLFILILILSGILWLLL